MLGRDYNGLDWGGGWQVYLNLLLRKFASEIVKNTQSSGNLVDNIFGVFGLLSLENGSEYFLQIYIAIKSSHYKASQPSSLDAVESFLFVLWLLRPYECIVNLEKGTEVFFAAYRTWQCLALR